MSSAFLGVALERARRAKERLREKEQATTKANNTLDSQENESNSVSSISPCGARFGIGP